MLGLCAHGFIQLHRNMLLNKAQLNFTHLGAIPCLLTLHSLCIGPTLNPLMYSAFAIELSDLSKPLKFARLKDFERLENCLTKGTCERF